MLLTTRELSLVLGMSTEALKALVHRDRLHPDRPGTTGTGKGHLYSPKTVLALAAARAAVKLCGAEATSAWRNGYAFLRGLPDAFLERELAEGRRFLLVAAGTVHPTLVGDDWVQTNQPMLREVEALGYRPALLDISLLQSRVQAKIRELDNRKTREVVV
jgi:hypothetical protein